MPRDFDTLSLGPASQMQEALAISHEPPDRPPPNPLTVLRTLLQGRYRLGLTLVLIGLVCGGLIGYFATSVTYRSTGIIRVRPMVAPILYPAENNGMLPLFDTFLTSQVALLTSQHVIELAMQNPRWKEFGRGDSPESMQGFSQNLEVFHPSNTEHLLVAFADPDPAAAMAGVHSIISAYVSLYGEGDAATTPQRLKALEDVQARYDGELKRSNERIRAIAAEYGSDSLTAMYQFRVQELQKLETELKSLQLQIAAMGVSPPESGQAPSTQPLMSIAQIAAFDPHMLRCLEERGQLSRLLGRLHLRFGDRHPTVMETRADLAFVEQEIDQLYRDYNSRDPNAAQWTFRPLEQLRARERAVRDLYDAARQSALELGRRNLQIIALREDADTLRGQLQETRKRIESLHVESAGTGRVSVISYAERPLEPFGGHRRRAMAGGAAAGAVAGLACVLLLGVCDRRLRGLTDAQGVLAGRIRVLGVVPQLSEDAFDSQEALTAAHAIHSIRGALQHADSSNRVIAITSPGPGDGKTSLALALGYSFAASGTRTLLVDLDLVGGGLSQCVSRAARPRIGRILRRQGLLDDQQVEEAVRLSAASGRLTGQVLVDGGHVTSADVERALAVQDQASVGVVDAMAGEAFDDCIVSSGTPGLSILPSGSAASQHIAHLSARTVHQLLQEARRRFDVVIVDTGPILASLEASIVTPLADQVVLTISHGSQRQMVLQAAEQLSACDAPLAGLVFNRATPADMAASTTSFGTRSRTSRDRGRLPDFHSAGTVSPVASAVAASAVP